jgi:hypothetical protein
MGNLFGFWALMKLGSLHQLWARAKHDLSGVSASMIDINLVVASSIPLHMP